MWLVNVKNEGDAPPPETQASARRRPERVAARRRVIEPVGDA
jgi:hypothetical protein